VTIVGLVAHPKDSHVLGDPRTCHRSPNAWRHRLVEGKVDFGGVLKAVNLSYTPEVKVGEYVVVHVGFAISIVDEAEARITLDYLAQLGCLG